MTTPSIRGPRLASGDHAQHLGTTSSIQGPHSASGDHTQHPGSTPAIRGPRLPSGDTPAIRGHACHPGTRLPPGEGGRQAQGTQPGMGGPVPEPGTRGRCRAVTSALLSRCPPPVGREQSLCFTHPLVRPTGKDRLRTGVTKPKIRM
ncbi:collagen, type I, alpha 1a-like [Dipodomys merriami]|uniref:collagen, type I, alpha 1a-like n=1 Tax=Dipodomys merriami TaxID=94247 RepID=UPI0038557312